MVQYNTALQNAFCAVLPAAFNSGTLELRDAANNVLCSIALPANAFVAAANGEIAKDGAWEGVGTAAAGTGTVCTNFRMVGTGGEEMSGTAGASGAELTLSNQLVDVNDDEIVEGNLVAVATFAFTQPGA